MRLMRVTHWIIMSIIGTLLLTSCETKPTEKPTPEPEVKSFSFNRVIPMHTSLEVDIIPENKEIEYIVLLSEKSLFVNQSIDTREELLADDYNYISTLAANYELSIHDFLDQVGWLTTGDKLRYSAANLYPDTEYVVYCYGVTFNGDSYEATTDICYEVIKTTSPDMINAHFNIECEVNGTLATINIDTNGYKGYYYYYVIAEDEAYYITDDKEVDNAFISHFRNRAFSEFNYIINDLGTPVSDFCSMGDKSFDKRFLPNTSYMVVAFAVSTDQTPLLCSTPSIGLFQTGQTFDNNLQLDIQVSNIEPYRAELTITPSNEDPYACVFLLANQIPMLDDELAVMENIISNYQPAILSGVYSEPLTPLAPLTEYVVIAFGCENNVPTTNLYTVRFTTPEAIKGTTQIDGFEVLKVYDVAEILAIDSSMESTLAEFECLMIATVHTTPDCDKVYWWWYDDWTLEWYEDDAFIEDLLMYDYTPTTEVIGLWYDTPVLFAGIAEDENGNYSDVYYGEVFTLTKDMCSPATEFFELIK